MKNKYNANFFKKNETKIDMRNLYVLLYLFLCCFVAAQTNTASLQVKLVNDTDGLTNLTVSSALLDDEGIVWIASDLGLFHYDGRKVKQVNVPNLPQLNSQRIICLSKDYNSNLIYFKTFPEEKSYVIENGSIRQLKDSEGILFDNFFLKSDSPFFKTYVNFTNKFSNTYDLYYSKVFLTKDNLFILTKFQLYFFEKNGTYSIVQIPENKISFICDFGDSVITLGSEIGVIKNSKVLYNTISTDKIILEFLDNEYSLKNLNVFSKSNEKYYLNFKSKIYEIIYDKNKLRTKFLLESKDDNILKLSYSKKEDIHFVGTVNSGFEILYQNKFNTIAAENNNNVEYTVIKNKSNWYSYNGWIYNLNTQKTQNRTVDNVFGNMRFLLEYNGDYFYEAANNELVSIIDLKTKAPFKVNDLNFLTGFTYLNKKLWLSNIRKCAYLQNNKLVFDTLVTKNLKKNQDINAINAKGTTLIIATTTGVILHKPFSIQFDYIKGLEKVNARYIKHIDQNSFWVGCYGDGLFLVKNNRAYKVTDRHILLNTAHAIEEDQLGNLWISTNTGLVTVNKRKAISQILKKIPLECYIFTKEDGLPTNEFNGGSTFPSIQTNGIIGFPTMKGFVWFDPLKVKKHLFKGAIKIDNIIINNKDTAVFQNGAYKIDENTEILKCNFSYGYFFNRDNLSIAYRFEDQTKWNEIKGNSIQIGRYKNGKHKLLIRITTHEFDEKQGVIKAINLNFEPRYYETFWFWGLVALLIISCIYLAYSVGHMLQKKKELQLKSKIDEKTAMLREMVSELEASRNSVSKSLLEKDVLLKEVHHRVKNNLQLIISMLNIQARRNNYLNIQEFLRKSETRISAMALIHERLYQNEESLDTINFQNYLENLISSIKASLEYDEERISVNCNANGNELNIITAIPLGLIVNELLTNAFKHAFPDNRTGAISISLHKIEDNKFVLVMEDNGIGCTATNKESKTFGKELVHLLTDQLRGNVLFDHDNGTRYTINFEEILH